MVKGTRHVLKAIRKFGKEVEFLLIQNQKWARCLELKATSHLFIDQLLLGYGNNAIEAWAMGLPVVAGSTSQPILARMRQEFGGELPFYATTHSTIEDDLRALVRSPELREEWATRGTSHVQRFHAANAWVARARKVYSGEPLTLAA
jgi:hypothetical protein